MVDDDPEPDPDPLEVGGWLVVEVGSCSCSFVRRGIVLFLCPAGREGQEAAACALSASGRFPPSPSSIYLPPCASTYRAPSSPLPILPFALDTWPAPLLSSFLALLAQLFSSFLSLPVSPGQRPLLLDSLSACQTQVPSCSVLPF